MITIKDRIEAIMNENLFELSVQLKQKNFKAWQGFVCRRALKENPRVRWQSVLAKIGLIIAFTFVLTILFVLARSHPKDITHIVFVFLGLFMGLGMYFLHALFISKAMQPSEKGNILRQGIFNFSQEGIHYKNGFENYNLAWAGVLDFEEDSNHYYLLTDQICAHIIPKTIFENDRQESDWSDFVRSNLNCVKNTQ